MPTPCTVTISEPVAARLALRPTLTCTWSIVCDDVKLATPPLQLVSIAAALRADQARPTSDRIEVSDTQVDPHTSVYPVLTEALCTARPILDPCTVTLAEPVAPTLRLDNTLSVLGSAETAALTLASLTPAVTCAFLLPIPPRPVPQTTAVSDSQLVASHAVSWPTRPLTVALAMPRLAPWILTRTDSLPAPLRLWPAWLTLPISVDMLSDTDPACSPTVSATRMLIPSALWAALPRTEVPDSHTVASHPVSPTDAHPVPLASPVSTPCTTTHAEPVPGVLVRTSELRSGTDTDRRPVTELTLRAVVSSTRPLPTVPLWYARQTIDESEAQVVDRHVSSPVRDDDEPETEPSPMLAPCRVTLTEPVAGMLPWSAPLTTPVSSGSNATMLPDRAPAGIDTRPFLLDPCDAEQSVEVCDAQVVASQAL